MPYRVKRRFGEAVTAQTVGVEGFGIRPAVTVDVDALAELTER